MRVPRSLAAAAAGLGLAISLAAGTASASSQVSQTFTATVTGTIVTTPANGILTVYDDALALHHSRTVEYTQHDGYSKTENLVSKANPLGVVLIEEDIENACLSSKTDGSENPVGGYDIPCGGMLVKTQPAMFPLGGDLTGRFCRVPQPPYKLHCPAMPPIHVNETAVNGVPGGGRYLEVGNKDHGAMLKVEYYANWTGVTYDVTIKLPIGTTQLPHGVLVDRIVLLPQGSSAPHAVLALQ